jgi:hypothetical protein
MKQSFWALVFLGILSTSAFADVNPVGLALYDNPTGKVIYNSQGKPVGTIGEFDLGNTNRLLVENNTTHKFSFVKIDDLTVQDGKLTLKK